MIMNNYISSVQHNHSLVGPLFQYADPLLRLGHLDRLRGLHNRRGGHSDYVSAAHRADLGLHEPLAQAGLVEHVAAVGHALQGLPLLELPQAYRAVEVLRIRAEVVHRLQQTHVGLRHLLRVGLVLVVKALGAVGAVAVL